MDKPRASRAWRSLRPKMIWIGLNAIAAGPLLHGRPRRTTTRAARLGVPATPAVPRRHRDARRPAASLKRTPPRGVTETQAAPRRHGNARRPAAPLKRTPPRDARTAVGFLSHQYHKLHRPSTPAATPSPPAKIRLTKQFARSYTGAIIRRH